MGEIHVYRVFYVERTGEPVKYQVWTGFPYKQLSEFKKQNITYIVYRYENGSWVRQGREHIVEAVYVRDCIEKFGLDPVATYVSGQPR